MSKPKNELLIKIQRILNDVSQARFNGSLSEGSLLDIKKQLVRISEQYDMNASSLFFKLWQEDDEQLRFLACYFLPKFINKANEENFALLDKIIGGLEGFRLIEVFAQNLAAAIQAYYMDWLIYLSRLVSYKNIWARCFLIQTLGYLADYKTIGIPYYLIIIKKMMPTTNETLQNCLSWSLLHLYNRWPESVRAFIESYKSSRDKNTIAIICGLSLGVGSWIIPLLEHWLLIDDQDIYENVKSTLLLLSKNLNNE